MSKMTYRGYTARIDFDERDNIFVGRVLGVNAIIGFHGETVQALRSDFESAIDFKIEVCAANGETLEKPASGKFMLRLPPEVHSAAIAAAQASGKSLNQWASNLLREAVTR